MDIPIFPKTLRPSIAMWKRLIWFLAAVAATVSAPVNADTVTSAGELLNALY